MVSKDVTYSTVQKTGLATGCYRVKEPGKYTERILIIKDQDTDENPVIVTELERNHRQIDVRDSVTSAPFRAVMPSAASGTAAQPEPMPKKVISFGGGGGVKAKEPKPAQQKKRKKDSDSNDTDEDEIELSSDDDSDDPSWGSSKRKKKNDAKAKKRRKNKY